MHLAATQRPISLLVIVRPYLALAVFAFLAGFGGYLILGPPRVMDATDGGQTAANPVSAALVSAPASDDWNVPKKI